VGSKVKVKVMERTRIVNEEGKQVGAVLKIFGERKIFCFLCQKEVSSLKHYGEH
jgi:hypothetical protein